MDKVTNLKYSVTGANSVLISWDTVPGATEYQVEIRQKNVTLVTQTVAVPEVPFTQIVIGELYEVVVVATDGSTTSDRSRLVVYLSINDWLPRVTDLAYSELESRDGMTVTWGASPGATSYRLICETYGAESQTVFDGAATSPHVLTGLVEETLYRITVIPVNEDVEGIAATTIGWIAPVVDTSRNSKTSHLLFPAEVQADFRLLYRPYIENMRPLREDDRYWRFVDHFDFIDGPPDLGTGYTADNITWEVTISEDGSGMSQIWLHRVGATEDYTYLLYSHPQKIDAVALEFDQSGRQIVVFESQQQIYLYWYDAQAAKDTLTLLGPGITPIACTNTYYRLGGAGDSERFVFFVDPSTQSVCGYRQSDRYTVKYSVKATESYEVLELLQCSKRLTGELTIVAAVRETDGSVSQKLWSYRAFGDSAIALGTDGDFRSNIKLVPQSADMSFALKEVINVFDCLDTASLNTKSVDLVFDLRSSINTLPVVEQTPLIPTSASISFELKQSVITYGSNNETVALIPASSSITDFILKVSKITEQAAELPNTLVPVSATLSIFELGV